MGFFLIRPPLQLLCSTNAAVLVCVGRQVGLSDCDDITCAALAQPVHCTLQLQSC